MFCQLKNCRKCLGDLVLDGDEWRCWQCGHYYYPRPEREIRLEEIPDPLELTHESTVEARPRI